MSGVSTATIIAGVSAAATLAGAGMQVFSAMNQSGAVGRSNNANLVIGQQNAALARDAAAADAADIEIANRKSLASIRANTGASGLLVEEGSPLEVLVDSAGAGELNRQRRLWQGELQARDALLGAEAAQRLDDPTGGYMRAGSSLLTGVSRVRDLLDTRGTRPPSPFGGPNADRPD